MKELQSVISKTILQEARKWDKKINYREIKEVDSVIDVGWKGEPEVITMFSGEEFDLYTEGFVRIWLWDTIHKSSWSKHDCKFRCRVTCVFVSDLKEFVVTNINNFIILD